MCFFEQLQAKNLISSWIAILDWLFDGQRACTFKKRSKEEKTLRMEDVKKLPYFKSENWVVASGKNQQWSETRTNNFCVKMVGTDSSSEALIRHIRNGIAHGTCFIITQNGVDMLEITDYKTDERNVITAYIWIPIEAMQDLYDIHNKTITVTKEAS